jgi:hypothetical protein
MFILDKNLLTATDISFLCRGVPATGLNRFLVIGWLNIAKQMINRPRKQPRPGQTLQNSHETKEIRAQNVSVSSLTSWLIDTLEIRHMYTNYKRQCGSQERKEKYLPLPWIGLRSRGCLARNPTLFWLFPRLEVKCWTSSICRSYSNWTVTVDMVDLFRACLSNGRQPLHRRSDGRISR